nr:site-specific integrase [Evansella tamaricis]
MQLDQGLGYYLIYLALATGARFSELVALTRTDFDFDNCTIRIDKTWGYMKRSPEGFDPTKNEKTNRIIRIGEKTMAIFRRLFDTSPPNIYNLVFFSEDSKYKVISNTGANKLLQKTLTELGIEPITMHGLRHTHASIMLFKGISIYYVS